MEHDGRKASVWSLGVVLFVLLARQLPFDAEETVGVLRQVRAGKFRIPRTVGEKASDLICKMIERDVVKRFDLQQVMSHEWFRSGPNRMPILKALPPTRDPLNAPAWNSISEPLDQTVIEDLIDAFGLWTHVDLIAKIRDNNMTIERILYWKMTLHK